MKPEPFSFEHSLADFDLTQVPVDAGLLRDNPTMLASAVQTYYEDCFRKLGGSAVIVVRDGVISVAWYSKAGDAAGQVFEHAVKLLRQGDYRAAEPLLRALLLRDPEHAEVLYNLGMMLSDQRKLEEATALLRRYVHLEPGDANGWTALGVAESRGGDHGSAEVSLRKGVEINPRNAYALQNLGALLIKDSPQEALPVLEQAARIRPDDQATQYGYAQCLLKLGKIVEAGPVLLKVIELSPLSAIAEMARSDRTAMADRRLRSAAGGGLRPDAVHYCLEGLQIFHDAGSEVDPEIRASG